MGYLAGGEQSIPSGSGDVITMGAAARAALVEGSQAKIMGVTTRGLFLAFSSGPVVFLSDEQFRGPLTINLPAGHACLAEQKLGDPACVHRQAIHFPSTGSLLVLHPAAIWRAATSDTARLERSRLAGRAEALMRRVFALSGEGGSFLAETAGLLFDSGAGGGTVRAEAGPLRQDLARLRDSLERFLVSDDGAPAAGDPCAAGVVAAAEAFLGRGRGLTPSGDDLILGLALILSRWGSFFWPARPHPFRASGLGASLTTLAARKTTLLSSCLISCACQGQADERLVSALDGLMTGTLGSEACAEHLLSWGSSSGGDTLCGIALAIFAGLRSQALEMEAGAADSLKSG